jgi:hypothetical protein
VNLKNLIDGEIYRKIYVFANEFFEETATKKQKTETTE